MKIYINYADKKFQKAQKFAEKMAKVNGDFDVVTTYSKEDIGPEFYQENKHILDQPRGGGYWLWKPHLICKKLSEINDGDYLFYSDSGAFFLKSVNVLIKELDKHNQDIMAFETPFIESQWTKKELFLKMKCEGDRFSKTNQIMASFWLIKKSNFSVIFFKEWLNYACDEENITDALNGNIIQRQDFIEHRHDQSISSLLYKKYKLNSFQDLTQFGKHPWLHVGIRNLNGANLGVNKLHVLKNGEKFRFFKYQEDYGLVIFHFRTGRPVLDYIKFLARVTAYKLKIYNIF
jgi:hypothetical protein